MKQILCTEVNGERVFIISLLTIAVVRAEHQLGIKIEPTGLQADKFGLSYASKHGKVFKSLKAFKQEYDKGNI